jgi:RNA polymerase sigma factor (sigma-70 family)
MLGNLLTSDEEVELGRRVRAGDLVARNELVERNRCFALHVANAYGRRCQCRESDLDQSALLGLVRGADAYDPDRHPGKRFLTIARYYVRLEIINYLYGRQLIRIPHSARPAELAKANRQGKGSGTKWERYRQLSEIFTANAALVKHGNDTQLNRADPSQSPDLDDLDVDEIEQLRLGLEMLSPWHADVLRRRFGLDGKPRETVRKIAQEVGLSKTSIVRIEKRALKRLREALSPCTA